MNKLQRLLLGIMLTIDALLVLFPPFVFMPGYRSFPGRPAGNHWFLSAAGTIDFAMLAYEILVVPVVGALLVALARSVPDEKIAISSGLRYRFN